MNRTKLLIAVGILCIARFALSDDLVKENDRVRVRSSSEIREDGFRLNPDEWMTGKLLQRNSEVLTLKMKDHQIKIAVNNLLQVQVSHGKARKKGVLIGLAVGAAAGLIYGAIDTASCNSQGGWFCGLAYGVTLITTPVGAFIGYVAAPEKWVDVPVKEFQGRTSSASRSFQLAFQW